MPSGITKKCVGLYTYPNRYDVPDGALVVASNILIRNEGEISLRWPTRTVAPNSTIVSGNLTDWVSAAAYKDRLWAANFDAGSNESIIGNLSLTNGVGTYYTGLEGPDGGSAVTNAQVTYATEFLPANNCLYFNAFDGIRRIQDATYGYVRAGGLDCAVACQPRPFSLAAGALVRTGGNVVTVTWPTYHGFATGMTVNVAANASSPLFTAGNFVITSVPSVNTFTYTDGGDANGASSAAVVVGAAQFVGTSGILTTNEQVAYRAVLTSFDANGYEYEGPASGRATLQDAAPYLGAGVNKNVQLAVLFRPSSSLTPSEQNVRVELYRTTKGTDAPGAEYKKVFEKYLTQTEREAGVCWITDLTPDQLLAKSLYTNGSQDGNDKNNTRPACGKTMALFKEQLALGNTNDFGTLNVTLMSTDAPSGGLDNLNTISFHGLDLFSERLTFTALDTALAGTRPGEFIRYTSANFSEDCRKTILSLIDTINWGYVQGPVDTGNIRPMQTYKADYASISVDSLASLNLVRTKPEFSEPGSADYNARFLYTADNRAPWSAKLAGKFNFTATPARVSNVTTVVTTAASNFTVGEHVSLYNADGSAYLIATIAVRGKIASVAGTTITITEDVGGADGTNAVDGYVASSYRPIFNTSRSLNRVWISRRKQYEAFPALSFVDVGTPNTKVLKMAQVADVLLVFKEEGLYRVTQSEECKFSSELLDNSAVLVAKDSVKQLNGDVFAWLSKGVARIGQQGIIEYVSDPIYGTLHTKANYKFLATDEVKHSFAYAQESENLYELRFRYNFNGRSDSNYIYNIKTKTWTSDSLLTSAEFSYNGLRYLFAADADVFGVAYTPYSLLAQVAPGGAFLNAATNFSNFTETSNITTVTNVGSDFYDVVLNGPFTAGPYLTVGAALFEPNGPTKTIGVGAASRTGTEVTIDWTTSHGFSTGMTIQVVSSAATAPTFDTGLFVITSTPSASTFTYEDASGTDGTNDGALVLDYPQAGFMGWVTSVTDSMNFRMYAPLGATDSIPVPTALGLTHGVPVTSVIEWAPITAVQEEKVKSFQEIQILFGRAGAVTATVGFKNEVEPAINTVTCYATAMSQNSALLSEGTGVSVPVPQFYQPGNLRLDVPNNKRRCQQLSLILTLRSSYTTVSVLGIGAKWRTNGTKVSR